MVAVVVAGLRMECRELLISRVVVVAEVSTRPEQLLLQSDKCSLPWLALQALEVVKIKLEPMASLPPCLTGLRLFFPLAVASVAVLLTLEAMVVALAGLVDRMGQPDLHPERLVLLGPLGLALPVALAVEPLQLNLDTAQVDLELAPPQAMDLLVLLAKSS